jgi:hypothetical protein
MTVKVDPDLGVYQITCIRDGIKVSDHYYDHPIEAVEAWHKFSDYGDAKEIRTILFIPPIGDVRTKSFYAKK